LAIIELGQVDPRSLFARLSFTRDGYQSAASAWATAKSQGHPADKPMELRTYVHELTHYQQYTTTPYGLFLQYCKILQNHATINLANLLLSAGHSLTPPLLLRPLPDLPPDLAQQATRCLSLWLNVEDLIATLESNNERRKALLETNVAVGQLVQQGGRPPLPPLLGFSQTFAKVQDSLADFIQHANQQAAQQGNQVPIYPGNIDQAAIAAGLEALPSQYEHNLELTELATSLLGFPWTATAIVESAASAAEFWMSDETYPGLTAWANAKVEPELAVYRNCLVRGLEAIHSQSLPSFLASYLTVCEIALFAPLLPQHAGLRAASPGLHQLLPVVRFQLLLGAAEQVEPMRGPSDHDRYVTDLCQSLGWVHPVQIVSSAMTGPQQVSDPVTYVYLQAQRWRAQQGSATFIGIDPFLFDASPVGQRWRACFDFVVIDYADRTTYNPDKDFLQSMTTRFLNMYALEALMRRDSLTLEAPYGRSDQENQWMTDWLRQRFQALFSRDFPDLKVVPRA
jgi:hypothetical protein